jgi:hypothetical protein
MLWLIAQWAFLRGNAGLSYLLLSDYRIDRVLLALWPSSIFLMADPEGRSALVPTTAIAVNAALYGVLGWTVWFGLNRRRFVLPVVAVVVIAGWYVLFRWYAGA